MLHSNEKQREQQAEIDQQKAEFFAKGGKIEKIPFGVSGLDEETGVPLIKARGHKARQKRLGRNANAQQASDAKMRKRNYNKDFLIRSKKSVGGAV